MVFRYGDPSSNVRKEKIALTLKGSNISQNRLNLSFSDKRVNDREDVIAIFFIELAYFQDTVESGFIQLDVCFPHQVIQGHFQDVRHFGDHFDGRFHLIPFIPADG